jgi:hypothetical protein
MMVSAPINNTDHTDARHNSHAPSLGIEFRMLQETAYMIRCCLGFRIQPDESILGMTPFELEKILILREEHRSL